MSNIKIQGVVTKIYPAESFQWNGVTYNFATVIIDTPSYQRFDAVAVKVNVDKTPINFTEGDNIDFECSIKSKATMTKDGREFWNTTITAWKINVTSQHQTAQQPVQQQPVQQTQQQQTTQDNDLPF